jgi:prepilin-type N-terminal cleavage/methylation domain-containing protein/prepilin-type processing-associated H-X9-DG protein
MKKIHNKKGFTLVELLVVISIIAVLLAVLMPSLNKARELARRIVCASNERNMCLATSAYVQSFGCYYPGRNGSHWLDWRTGQMLRKDYDSYWQNENGTKDAKIEGFNVTAYWGVAYAKYGADMGIFKCPSKKTNGTAFGKDLSSISNKDLFLKSTGSADYAMNGFIFWKSSDIRSMQNGAWSDGVGARKIAEFKTPASTVVTQDHYEGVMEFNNGGDSYYFCPTAKTSNNRASVNFAQWRITEPRKPGSKIGDLAIKEILRHGVRTSNNLIYGGSNVLWLDGHVTYVNRDPRESVPYNWYTGGVVPEF